MKKKIIITSAATFITLGIILTITNPTSITSYATSQGITPTTLKQIISTLSIFIGLGIYVIGHLHE